MPNPKRQHSKARTRRRRTHQKLTVLDAAKTGSGSKAGFSHRICPITGCYKGKQVVEPKAVKAKA
ncbi:MAG: 50S ribosomal protein L32 [Candidatus Omnitrophica bacterium]|nr:50S ribosomal protein L32 [Candidatus Omnitrophota bacterium]